MDRIARAPSSERLAEIFDQGIALLQERRQELRLERGDLRDAIEHRAILFLLLLHFLGELPDLSHVATDEHHPVHQPLPIDRCIRESDDAFGMLDLRRRIALGEAPLEIVGSDHGRDPTFDARARLGHLVSIEPKEIDRRSPRDPIGREQHLTMRGELAAYRTVFAHREDGLGYVVEDVGDLALRGYTAVLARGEKGGGEGKARRRRRGRRGRGERGRARGAGARTRTTAPRAEESAERTTRRAARARRAGARARRATRRRRGERRRGRRGEARNDSPTGEIHPMRARAGPADEQEIDGAPRRRRERSTCAETAARRRPEDGGRARMSETAPRRDGGGGREPQVPTPDTGRPPGRRRDKPRAVRCADRSRGDAAIPGPETSVRGARALGGDDEIGATTMAPPRAIPVGDRPPDGPDTSPARAARPSAPDDDARGRERPVTRARRAVPPTARRAPGATPRRRRAAARRRARDRRGVLAGRRPGAARPCPRQRRRLPSRPRRARTVTRSSWAPPHACRGPAVRRRRGEPARVGPREPAPARRRPRGPTRAGRPPAAGRGLGHVRRRESGRSSGDVSRATAGGRASCGAASRRVWRACPRGAGRRASAGRPRLLCTTAREPLRRRAVAPGATVVAVGRRALRARGRRAARRPRSVASRRAGRAARGGRRDRRSRRAISDGGSLAERRHWKSSAPITVEIQPPMRARASDTSSRSSARRSTGVRPAMRSVVNSV